MSFVVGGWPMWVAAFFGGLLGGIAYPAFSVYRTELFPTGTPRPGRRVRSRRWRWSAAASGLITAGQLLDRGWSYGSVMGMLASGQLRRGA